jgi:hypothetical protein
MAIPESPDGGWTLPESASNVDERPQYPYNKTFQTESGHTIEIDDTPGRERIRVAHRTKSYMEMHPDGDFVVKSVKNGYEVTGGKKLVKINGICNVTIEGDSIVHVKGNKFEKIDGDYKLTVNGDFTAYSPKKVSLMSDDVVQLGGGSTLGLGRVVIGSASSLTLNGDLRVRGEIIGDMITSNGRVDAATGVSAGPLGFVSVLGGLSIGIPLAVPGTINCIGIINGTIMVTSPLLGSFTIMTSTWMTDTINTTLYGIHNHIAPKGPTSPPLVPML